jgi:aspartyl-tRNA(Asn)/glutamyl-tRNA(Gln) amidotransferase subunit A
MIRERDLSPVELVEAYLRRIATHNPVVNAFCTVTAETAIADARAAEDALVRRARRTIGELGMLHGVPCAIKDVTYTKNVRTTLGSRLFADNIPAEDAPLVARLKQSGAIVLGKTNTPELGWKGVTDNRLFGITRNPWNTALTPGGSSGGSAVAVASGMCPLASGTDGAGSIRIPSSFCGIVGLKPSFGLVPNYPPSAAELVAHAGPMTRTVRDAALMLDVIAGPDDRDRNSLPAREHNYVAACVGGIEGLRVGWSVNLGFAPVDPEIAMIVASAARRFTELGCVVETPILDLPDPCEALSMLFYGGIAARLTSMADGWRHEADAGLVRVVDDFASRSAVDYGRALFARVAFWDRIRPVFEAYDVLVTPTMPVPAFPVSLDFPVDVAGQRKSRLDWTPFTYPFNLTGQPAMTVPCGFTNAGLPVGLQIVGRRFADATVLRAAAAFEALAPWKDMPSGFVTA